MSFAESADRRIAGHGADRFAREADQSDGRAHARGGCRGLRAGVAAADDNDVELSRHGWAFNERAPLCHDGAASVPRSEEHTSELQSLMRISYAVFCLKQTQRIEQQNGAQMNELH